MMTLRFRAIDPVCRPLFGVEVPHVDITWPLTQEQAVSIKGGHGPIHRAGVLHSSIQP